MDEDEIRKLRKTAEKALQSAKDAERWAMGATNTDSSGSAHQAWVKAKDAVKGLEDIVKALKRAARDL